MRVVGTHSIVLASIAASLALASGASCKGEKERRQIDKRAETKTATVTPDTHSEKFVDPKPVVPKGPSGTVTGVVKFTGTAPEMPFINNGTDPECAKKKLRAETILVNANGTLKNAIVRIKPGTIPALKPDQPVVVRQLECMYRPRVQGAVAGQELIVVNGDETSHNVHVRAAAIGDRQGAEALWNRQQPKASSGLAPIRSVVENHPVMRLKCDQHGWMSGYLLVSDNPYSAVTDDQGAFSFAIPAGDHTIEAWHEFYGLKQAKLTVADGATASIDFSFDANADNPTGPKSPVPSREKGP